MTDSDTVKRYVGVEASIETRPSVEADSEGRYVLRGLGIPYDSLSRVVGKVNGVAVREVIRPGAFTEVLKRQAEQGVDIVSFVNHDENMILARQSAGTLQLTEDEAGVHYAITLSRTSYAEDLVENVRVGNVDGASFMFSARSPGLVIRREGDVWLRDIQQASALVEIGPVVTPAYAMTDCKVSLRSVQAVADLPARATGFRSVVNAGAFARLAIARMNATLAARP